MAKQLAEGIPLVDADALLEIAEAQIATAGTLDEAIEVIRRLRRSMARIMVETAVETILAETNAGVGGFDGIG